MLCDCVINNNAVLRESKAITMTPDQLVVRRGLSAQPPSPHRRPRPLTLAGVGVRRS
jgi:hypothetical protein